MAQTTRARARGGAKSTTDHDEIRRWAEERGGKPAVVKKTANGRQPGILRIDFPGFSGEQSLEQLEWDDWFERFDSAQLAFLYQDETGSGRPSRFNKLVSRETAEKGNAKRSSARATGARGGGTSARGGARTRSGKRATPAKKATSTRGRATSRTKKAAPRSSSRTKRSAKSGSQRRSQSRDK
jgi:hypothetical protein